MINFDPKESQRNLQDMRLKVIEMKGSAVEGLAMPEIAAEKANVKTAVKRKPKSREIN